MRIFHLLRKAIIIFGLSLTLFSDSMSCVTHANAAESVNQKYEVRIVTLPGEHETGLREYIYEDGSVRTEEIPATGHVWSEWIVDVEPTYTKEGHMYRVCEKIPGRPHYEERTIPKLTREKENKISADEAERMQSETSANPNISNVVTDSTEPENREVMQTLEQEAAHREDVSTGEDSMPKTTQPSVQGTMPQTNETRENTGFNAVDALFIAGVFGTSFFAYFFVFPLLAVLVWARKKRREIMGE